MNDKNNTHGGKRAGSGRKPAGGLKVRKLTITLLPEEIAAFDEIRGELSRGKWLSQQLKGIIKPALEEL